MATELQPDDYCRSCREWVTFPNAVFVLGPNETVQLMCEHCVAESKGDGRRRIGHHQPHHRPHDAGEA